jgi:hypothetical protein
MAHNIARLWVLTQTNNATVDIDINAVNDDGTFNLQANHSGGAVTGSGPGRIVGDQQVFFTITWSDNTQGAYNGVFGPDGFLNGSTFDVKHPGSFAGWRSNMAF